MLTSFLKYDLQVFVVVFFFFSNSQVIVYFVFCFLDERDFEGEEHIFEF